MLPYEIILYIIKLLNDMDANISFKLINKIEITKYQNIENLLKFKNKNIVVVTTENKEKYIYYYIKISNDKYYRIIKVVNNYYDNIEIKISICDYNLPLYNIPISVLYL